MQCNCGFSFAKAVMEESKPGYFPFETFTVICDNDVSEYVKLESQVSATSSLKEVPRRIAAAAKLAGRILICPRCAALHFLTPKTDAYVQYQRISDKEN